MVMSNLNMTIKDYEEKLQKCQEFVDALEEERKKILVSQRELPLCLELVTQAIEACKQQVTSGATEYHYFNLHSECSEQTSSEGPVLEEFIPIKRADVEQLSKGTKNNYSTEIDSNINDCVKENKNNDNKESNKLDWLSSVRLWNQSPDPAPKEDTPKKVQIVEVKENGISGSAFHPFKRDKSVVTSSQSAKEKCDGDGGGASCKAVAANSSVKTGGSSESGGVDECRKEEKEGETQRKQRRCWSSELHKSFLRALKQLGGSHVAKPKQILELMKVDGLTNDEVKSHLQKYRLHMRRKSPPMHNNTTQQAPQFDVAGGISVPPQDYAAMGTTPSCTVEAPGTATPNQTYATIASDACICVIKTKAATKESELKCSRHSEGGGTSHSPAMSSTDNTTLHPLPIDSYLVN